MQFFNDFSLYRSANLWQDADRIEELAAQSTEGELSEEERAEYEGDVRANKFIYRTRNGLCSEDEL